MPSPSVFGRTIENAARRIPKSDDASVQKRIDSLFSSTRDMLTKFLNTRPVTELQDQVNEAAKTQPPAAAETTEAPADAAAFKGWIDKAAAGTDPFFYAVIDKKTGRAEGRQSLMRIDTVLMKVGPSENPMEVVLLSPTHPLRVLWLYQFETFVRNKFNGAFWAVR